MHSMAQCVTAACLLDVSIPKPGNVHRGADFEDVTFVDFALSAVAIGPAMEAAASQRLGETVLSAVRATGEVTASNTNLGIILLLAPLAAVAHHQEGWNALPGFLQQLCAADAADVFEAIRLAHPGGLGEVDEMDVHSSVPEDLIAAMELARDRDTIALQYVTDFALITERLAPELARSTEELGLVEGVLDVTLRLLADVPDTLIARKCGTEMSRETATRASNVFAAGPPNSEQRHEALADFDFWLRSDGHRRNPGTTADLITAGLFCCLADGRLPLGRGAS